MNQMIDALRGIMDQSQGGTLDVPHPADFKNVKITELTGWHDSALKSDWHREEDGDWTKTVVKGRLAEVTHFDEYDEPIGFPTLILQHKYSHPTRQSKDISTTNVQAFEIRKLKARFPEAFAEYELKLARTRAEIPLALFDSVPPEVIQVILTMGARTVRDFAEFSEERIATLLTKLHGNNMAARANYVLDYVQRAREMVSDDARPQKRGPGRPPLDRPQAPAV